MESPLREYLKSRGAVGVASEQLEALRGLVGGSLPPAFVSFLLECGEFDEEMWDQQGSDLEWGIEPFQYGLLPLAQMLALHQGGWGAVIGWKSVPPFEWLVIAEPDPFGSGPCMRIDSEGAVFTVTLIDDQPAAYMLLAGSFEAFEAGVVLPAELSELAELRQFHDEDEVCLKVRVPEQGVSADRAVASFDSVLDVLLPDPLPGRGDATPCLRSALLSEEAGWMRPRAQVPIGGGPRLLTLSPRSLLCRFHGVSRLLSLVAVLEQVGGEIVDRMGLFSADLEATYSAADIVGALEQRVGGSASLDELAFRFRSEFAVPAAGRIVASLSA